MCKCRTVPKQNPKHWAHLWCLATCMKAAVCSHFTLFCSHSPAADGALTVCEEHLNTAAAHKHQHTHSIHIYSVTFCRLSLLIFSRSRWAVYRHKLSHLTWALIKSSCVPFTAQRERALNIHDALTSTKPDSVLVWLQISPPPLSVRVTAEVTKLWLETAGLTFRLQAKRKFL